MKHRPSQRQQWKNNQVSVSLSVHSSHKCCWTCCQNLEKSFLSGLEITDPKLPASEWYRLIPQDVINLNILFNSRVNYKLSAHSYFHVNFDFNTTPLAPLGTISLIHSKLSHEKLGQPTGNMDGTLDPHRNTIVVSNFMYHKPMAFEILT